MSEASPGRTAPLLKGPPLGVILGLFGARTESGARGVRLERTS